MFTKGRFPMIGNEHDIIFDFKTVRGNTLTEPLNS